jgi:hypothetical protein
MIMACGELAALRLGLAGIMGLEDEAQKAHDEAEMATDGKVSPLLSALSQSRDLQQLTRRYEEALVDLGEKVAKMTSDDPRIAYYRTLMVTTKKVEMELERHRKALQGLYEDLDEVHDYIHEIYPN